MSTSIGELLTIAAAELRSLGTSANDADIVVSLLAPTGRALMALTDAELREHEGVLSINARHTAELASACQHAAAAWSPVEARSRDAAGSAADITTQLAAGFTSGQRWAVSNAFAEVAATATTIAQGHEPYRRIPHLISIRHRAAALQQRATIDPPTRADNTALQHLVALSRHPDRTGLDIAAGTAIALTSAVHAAAARRALTLRELIVVSTVAEAAARYAKVLARTAHPDDPGAAAAAAWHAVTVACGPFDDGTKGQRTPTDILRLARALDTNLRAALGPADAGLPERLRGQSDPAALTTHLQTVAIQLPDLAAQLHRGTCHWIEHKTLLAPERLLSSFEQRNDVAHGTGDRVVFAESSDLTGLLSALSDAGLQSTALALNASHASRSGDSLAADRPISRDSTPRLDETAVRRSANRVARRASATAVARWTIPRGQAFRTPR